MNYIYTIIYRFEGISDTNLVEDKVVCKDDVIGITVLLTKDINRHCIYIDTGLACAGLILRGMLADDKLQKLPEAIKVKLQKIQESRRQKKKSGAYVVIIIKGNEELYIDKKLHKEIDQFHICFDAIEKDSLRNQHKEKVHSIVSSLSMCTDPAYHAERISSGIHFVDDNGKPLYSFTVQGGRARVILAKPVDIERENEIDEVINLSIGNQQLKTPFRLFTQSLEIANDELRSFISAWSALEIFTNKVFSIYEKQFIINITDDHNSHGVNQFLARIKNVMKDKYRLSDKFSLIASFLSNEIEEDIKLFKSLKDIRDIISHGKEFDEESLPVEDARKLAAKYLKCHLLSTKIT